VEISIYVHGEISAVLPKLLQQIMDADISGNEHLWKTVVQIIDWSAFHLPNTVWQIEFTSEATLL
jgi:hypothetical protein